MYLRRLSVLNYKNYGKADAVFEDRFILLNGDNGSGKTNLIDAIYYLCMCKSYFTRQDALIVGYGSDFFRLDGDFTEEGTHMLITCKYDQERKKTFARNGAVYEKLSAHVGSIPVVMIAPADIDIINGGSEERRRFMDMAISLLDPVYLPLVIEYNKILVQRNSLLKQFIASGRPDDTLLAVLDAQLAVRGDKIFKARKNFIESFGEELVNMYKTFSSSNEEAHIQYVSQLESNDLLTLLRQSLKKDVEAQRTTTGIHRDDLQFSVNSFPLKQNGSQGQIKSFLIALKLVLGSLIERTTLHKPLLLLDDVFEKLDKKRLHVLFALLKEGNYGQIFITDADEKRSTACMQEAHVSFQPMRIEKGEIS